MRKGKELVPDEEKSEIPGAMATKLKNLKDMFQESQVASGKSISLLVETEPPFTQQILSYHMSSRF